MKQKLTLKTEVALKMIQLIAGSKAFHSMILKMKFGVEEVLTRFSPVNLDYKCS